jgi:osmoprotectant transport system substrate-binding protein
MRMSLKWVVIAAAVLGWVPGALAQTIKVGSKNFTEQFIVAELYAASLEAAGFKVERKINLGATLIAHEAIKAGAIDVYPEYTGTGLVAVMKVEDSPERDPGKVYQRVKTFYEMNFNLTWLAPSRIDNGNAIVVRPETASQFSLKTLSDLGRAAGKLTLGGGSEFFDRYDGVPGLKAVYGIQFADARQFAALRLRYEALANKQVDVTNGFATDWQIPSGKFVALDDDKRLFPPYALAPVVRMDLARNKEAVAALDRVNALLDNPTMQELNRQVEVDKKEPKRVAAEFLKARGVTH